MILADWKNMVIIENPLGNTPKLDYTTIMNGGAKDEILHAMQEYAFFYIVNIPNFDPQAEIEVMKAFFSQPQDIKEKYASNKNNPSNSNVLRGWFWNFKFNSDLSSILIGQWKSGPKSKFSRI